MVNGIKSWKEFDELKTIDQKYYCSNYYDISVNKYGVKCGTSLSFQENKGWINSIDSYGWLQWYFTYWLGRRSLDYERQITRQKGIVSRFKGKLVKMIKDANGRFDDYSISPKIRKNLLYWRYNQLKVISYGSFFSYKIELLLVQQTRIIAKGKKQI